MTGRDETRSLSADVTNRPALTSDFVFQRLNILGFRRRVRLNLRKLRLRTFHSIVLHLPSSWRSMSLQVNCRPFHRKTCHLSSPTSLACQCRIARCFRDITSIVGYVAKTKVRKNTKVTTTADGRSGEEQVPREFKKKLHKVSRNEQELSRGQGKHTRRYKRG